MTTVIFVHGTSVREPEFSETFELIKNQLNNELPDIKVIPCSWGDSLGAKLNAEGASIPLYDETQKSDEENLIDEKIIRWQQLYQDPLYELRLLSIRTPEEKQFKAGQENLEDKLKKKVKQFAPSEELQNKLKSAGIDELLEKALKNVTSSKVYRDALKTITNTTTEYRNAIARAVIAEVMAICQQEKKFLPIMTDADLRDEIVDLFSSEIMDSEMAIGDWVKEKASKLLATGGTYYLKRNRGSATDASYPIVGDILLYQVRGEEIRKFIQTFIDEADSSVVLIGHSLGGIACVDLLALQPQKKVKLLVTVGSQAPFFYEIGALQSLKYGEKLPDLFPSWLNIYDLKDILSYIGGSLFPDKVEDKLVDNKQPFPRSHGAYWTNSATWKAIVRRIKSL
ncbi:MAG: hypothetical protein WBM44_04610 [Waterburya sp.]